MNKPCAALAALVTLAAACGTPSEVDPAAQVDITGLVVDQVEAPVADARAVLVKEIGVDEFLSGAMTVMTTWGFACALDEPVDPCGEYAHFGTSTVDGAFEFRLRGSDVRSGFGTASTMTATVVAPARDGERAGAAVSLSFQVQDETMQLPAFRLWQPQIDVTTAADGSLLVSWPTMPSDYPPEAHYEAVISDELGRPIWTITDSGHPVDLRVLEDVHGGVAVQATSDTTVDDRGAQIVHRSAQLPLTGPGAPPSRGASCATAADGRTPVVARPCPLTDGDLATMASLDMPSDCPTDGTECDYPDGWIVIDLGATQPLRLLVIRGDEDDLVVDVSGDGQSWHEVGRVEMTAATAALTMPSDTTGRYVRIRAERGDVSEFAEISIW